MRRFTWMIPLAAVVLGLAGTAPAAAQDANAGRRALERYGCAGCHTIPGISVALEASCVQCHQELARRPRRGLGVAPSVRHYLDAPDLTRATRRLSGDYLARFIVDPHDVRPRLEESMPRLPVSPREARDMVAYLGSVTPGGAHRAPATAAPDRSRIARGREVFVAECASCHSFGNLDPGFELPAIAVRNLGAAASLAPNLRFARDRMDADRALVWIQNPRAIDPETHMDKPSISRDDALAVRDFLFLGDPGEPVTPAAPPSASQLASAGRRVRFGDVRRVFGRSCIHCHSHTTGAESVTSLGFEQASLDLATWEGVRAGVELADGSRRSVLEPGPEGSAPLVSRLLTRHAEARRDFVGRLRDDLSPALRRRRDEAPVGMPLGLPPVPIDDIRLVQTWIDQGAPR